jgi:hypothetical protein
MPTAKINPTLPRGGHPPLTKAEVVKLLKRSTISREDHLRITNTSDQDYSELEDLADECLDVATDFVVPWDGQYTDPRNKKRVIAGPGDQVRLFILSGGGADFTSRLSKPDKEARARFPDIFGLQDKEGTENSKWPGEEELDIYQLTNKERETLLYHFWKREGRRMKEGFTRGAASPERRKRRATGMAVESSSSPTKKFKSAPKPRLYNSQLVIREVKPVAEEDSNEEDDPEERFTGEKQKIWFNKFYDIGDYKEILDGTNTKDLDTSLFDVNKLASLIQKGGKFSFATGELCLKKDEPRFDYDPVTDKEVELEYVISNPRDRKAQHYLQNMLEQLVDGANADAAFKFEMEWKSDKYWKTQESS